MISLKSKRLPVNTGIHLLPTSKFKTTLVSVSLQQVLNRESAAQTALLPAVLKRGTKQYPTLRDLEIRLEELYGATLTADVVKRGERQILTFSLEVINDKFAPGENLLQQGLSILKEVIGTPLLENGGFHKDYVRQEKEQLAREIQGLVNDKVNYALERCVQEMCSGERFGVYKYGSVEELQPITSGGLYDYYREILRGNPLDIFVVGEVDIEETFSLIRETFDFGRSSEPVKLPPVRVECVPERVSYEEEKLPVNQGKLTLGYRTNLSYSDGKYLDLLFYNGVLGGFPHSKLFQNVREKASLAYYVFSRLEKHKGIQLIGSGIEVKDYRQALDIILQQVDAVKKGQISREEMENTRRGIINRLKIIGDSPYSLVGYYLDGLIGGRPEERTEELIQKVERITKDDVVAVAENIHLDTVYFLRSTDEEEGGAN
ncbi:MAG: insulinase family protein [Firmicutes bacterium]|nr:insulinase family protein [Bacillota bacterium]